MATVANFLVVSISVAMKVEHAELLAEESLVVLMLQLCEMRINVNNANKISRFINLPLSGAILSESAILPSSQSTTFFLSVTLTNPTASPLSRACFIYSAPGASLNSHARYTASTEKKSEEDDPGLRYLVGLDFVRETEGDRTRCVAVTRDVHGPSALA